VARSLITGTFEPKISNLDATCILGTHDLILYKTPNAHLAAFQPFVFENIIGLLLRQRNPINSPSWCIYPSRTAASSH